jgi:anti-sigma factor RsiW
VSCTFSKEELALHVEGDLSAAAAQVASKHVAACEDCRRLLEQLGARQALLKTLRHDTVSPSECTSMRRQVMATINDRRDEDGWLLRIERAIMLGFRRRSYALAACALLAIGSVSLLGLMRRPTAGARQPVAVFAGTDTLFRPEGYRDWIVVGAPAAPHHPTSDHGAASPTATSIGSVYINPSGYQGYVTTG